METEDININSEGVDGFSNGFSSAFSEYLKKAPDAVLHLDLRGLTILEIIEKMIQLKERMHPTYRAQYGGLIMHLTNIQNLYGVKLMPEQVTDAFWHLFIPYLVDRGLSMSTISKLAYQLRHTIDWAGRHNALVSTTFGDFEMPKINTENVALTPDQVSWVYHFDIDTIKRRIQYRENLKKVRDMFVLSCCLGQRHSDMLRINRSCFERNTFKIKQQKTGNLAVVDLDKFAIDKRMLYDILERYNYEAPYKSDISNYNKYIKELFYVIGMDDEIKKEEKVLGEIKVKTFKLWELIGSHTARRTFATINFLRNYPKREIMRATGHSTEAAFNKYISYGDTVS